MLREGAVRTAGAVLTALAIGCATWAGADLLEVTRRGEHPQGRVTQNDVATTKLTLFYMSQNDRVWGNLALYQAEATVKAAARHKVNLSLLTGVIAAESEGYPFARSSTGAKGPGQVDFKAHEGRFPQIREERDKYDPEKNIACAAELLKEYTSKFGIRGGLQAYNLGETAYKAGKRNPRYVRRVLKCMAMYNRS